MKGKPRGKWVAGIVLLCLIPGTIIGNLALESAMGHAAEDGDVSTIRCLFFLGIKADESDSESNFTPLMTAAQNGHVETMRLLLDHGARVNVRDITGTTPLMNGCQNGNLEVVKMLIEHGAYVNYQNERDGETALTTAIEDGSTEAVKFLISQGANLDVRTSQGYSPLGLAIAGKNAKIGKLLRDAGAKP